MNDNEQPDEDLHSDGGQEKSEDIKSLVRLRKKVLINPYNEEEDIDQSIVSPRFYNNFSYGLLPKDQPEGCLKFGITSAGTGDGKTLVASNLAVSIAIANEKKTLLVDLNIWRPVIHRIFGVYQYPGFLDSLGTPEITVSQTKIDNQLYRTLKKTVKKL